MFDLIIRHARLPDEQRMDVAILGGRIAAVGEVTGTARQVLTLAEDVYLSAGWIDSHVHCYPASPIYHDEPDRVGIDTGVTTVIDAGSTGANDVDDFHALASQASTRVLALLNVSRIGLITQAELANLDDIDGDAVCDAVRRLPDFIVGLKARMSSSVVGRNGIEPLRLAKSIQQRCGGLPLMVHVGNTPPDLDEIAGLLSAGDILTHCYNGKPNRMLTPAGELRAAMQAALARGVRLDVGHGSASLSFEVARQAIAQGILPDTISSDIYCRNRLDGPVRSLAHVMSKFLALGMTLPQVIERVTCNAADGLRLPTRGRLSSGLDADLTLFRLREGDVSLADSDNVLLQGHRTLIPLAAMVAGQWFMTNEGKKHHVFNV
ncbi:amidohydrolase/deacetylase family metallohydrolase [Dickeya undicola]|uniref:amidohydrolase/deacetylase family metallohydrolase n=1 Tax=Dickeya undicola TaxID=1577887 RepID=UPI000532C962|nr:amidohydrolase/deacetylase family metallohydrolase [Dickeya undicola]